jgi:hypothetical protein
VKLTPVTQVSVDGVMQALGGPDEDEITLFDCPLVVGQGTPLFPDTGPDRRT